VCHHLALSEGQKRTKERIRMSKESVEKLVREKAEESAKQEAWISHFLTNLPFVFIACIMAVTGVSVVLFTIVLLTGLLVSFAIYFSTKPYAYKKYYEKYLEEFTVLRGDDKG
jgi:Flp pilus assembly protein TadB